MKKTIGIILTSLLMFSAVLFMSTPCAKAVGSETRYAFWPNWVDHSGYEPNWDCLTHVSYFYLDAQPDGKLDTTYLAQHWGQYASMRDAAHSEGVKVTLTVTCIGRPMDYDRILAYYSDTLANNVLQEIQACDADGVCMDFERWDPSIGTNYYTGESNVILMEQLMQVLYTTLKSADPTYHVSFCVSPGIDIVYRNSNLQLYSDAVLLMEYNFHGDHYSSDTDQADHYTGPNSPYYNDNFDVQKSIARAIGDEVHEGYFPASMVVPIFPLYGWKWKCLSQDAYAVREDSPGEEITMGAAILEAASASVLQYGGRLWDTVSSTPWYRYQEGGQWHQCWYDDAESIKIKYEYAKSVNLAGIGFFALYNQNDASIWNAIGTRTGRSGGPDFFGYTYTDSNCPRGPAYDWIEISGTASPVLLSSDDQWVGGIGLGFFFNYYGTDYSQLAIGNNGLLFSGVGTSQYVNQPITQTPGIHGLIAPFWDDIVTWGSAASAVYYETQGTAPNRKFIVEWYDNQHYYSSTSGITFEAILYEGSNNILFQYQDVDFGTVSGSTSGDLPPYNNGGSATVGIEDPTGSIGLQYSFDEQVINPGLAILFKFPAFAGTNMHLSMNAPTSMDHGNTMTYTLYYNNFGDTTASNVVLQATLSSQLEFVSASDGGTYDPSTRGVTWNIGSVAAFPSGRGSRTVTVTIPASVSVGTVIQTTASISTDTLETRYDDNSASAQTTVTGSNLPPNVGVGPTLGNSGGTPMVYWTTPITFTYNDPTATGVDIRIHLDDGRPDITGSMTGGPPAWTYTVTFYPRCGHATVTYTVHGPVPQTINFNLYVDPAGYIYDVVTLARISGASVWLQTPDGQGGWENVPTGQNPPIMQPDINPQVTGADGQYQWDVLDGTYRVHVEAPGYYFADSIVVTVPPPVTDLHIGLTPLPPSPDQTPPTTTYAIGIPQYTDVSGNIYVTSTTPFTLSAEDNVGGSGVATTGYRIRNTGYDSGWLDSAPPIVFHLTGLSNGEYSIDYNSTDNSANVEATNTATVILDNTPPTTSLAIGQPKYPDPSNNVYVSMLTPFVLIATDNLGAGVASTSYRIYNNTYDRGWLAYSSAFYLTDLQDGTYSIDYNSTDAMGNVEPKNTATVILDNTPPTTNPTIGDPKYVSGRIYVTPDTPFTLTATDAGSGVKLITYRINSTSYDSGWLTYTKPFNLSSLGDGNYTIAYNSTDNVGNVEPSKTVNVTLVRAKWLKQDALNQLNSLVPTGNKKVDGKIMEAAGKIKQSLGTTPWIDENHPNPKYGKQVFDKEEEAVQELMVILRGTDASQTVKNKIRTVIDELVVADKEIAFIAIFDAKAKGSTDCRVIHEIKEADEEYSEALKAITKGNYDHAVEEFGHAWIRAQHAMKKAFGDVNADGKVNLIDCIILANAFGSCPGQPKWNPMADLNGDNKVDMRDCLIICANLWNVYD